MCQVGRSWGAVNRFYWYQTFDLFSDVVKIQKDCSDSIISEIFKNQSTDSTKLGKWSCEDI